MKKISQEVKVSLLRFISVFSSLLVSNLILRFVFKLDNFWITVAIASVLSVSVEFIVLKKLDKRD